MTSATITPMMASPSTPRLSPAVGSPRVSTRLPEREGLFAEFQPLVRRLLAQYGDSVELKQDLQGELYCRFCELYQSFDAARGVPLRGYLVRMLTAFAHTYTRAYRRRYQREVGLPATWDVADPSPVSEPFARLTAGLDTEEAAKRLPSALSALSDRQRQVVIWRYYEERSFEEIAEVLGVQPATVRSLLRHGLNNLRSRLLGQ
jgi:RNA polymerase sigma factor (sigma-70 family)